MRSASMRLPARQRGLAMLIILALFFVAAAYMLVSSLNQSSNALVLARAAKNRDALMQAKAALLAWSAAQALTVTRPGSLPCPDLNNDGSAESSCSSSSSRLGRLPYKTLGIAPIYDASGELLWYGLSNTFRNYTGTINSDTQGALTIYNRDAQGNEAAEFSNVVAVLLAPGAILASQDRSWSGSSCSVTTDPCNTASNYLEGRNGDTNSADYVIAAEDLTDSVTTNLFNDQLLAVTKQDLFAVVEPVVASRIQSDIVRQFIYDPTDTSTSTLWSDTPGPNKSRYFNAWGRFPFAAPFVSPPSSTSSPNYTGQDANPGPAKYEGLLPVVSNFSYTWNSVAFQTSGSGTVWNGSYCTRQSSNTLLYCNIWYTSGALTISISGAASNVGNSFVQLPQLADLTISCSGCSLSSRSLSGSLDSSAVGTVTFSANLSNVSNWANFIITVPQLSVSALTSTTSTEVAGWYNINQWYKQTYYAISPGYAPGGTGTCNPTSPKCLNVYNLPSPYANPTTDTRAILILAGRSLSGATRPNGTLSDYLEAKNASTGDYSFEHGLSKISSTGGAINDKVIPVAP